MFVVFNKDKILSYIISLSTVTLLFVMSFAITRKNDEILRASTNAIIKNTTQENAIVCNELNQEIKDMNGFE